MPPKLLLTRSIWRYPATGHALERGGGHVEARVRGEAEGAHLAGDAGRDLPVARVGGHGDADGAAVLDRGADGDAHRAGHAAGVEVAAVVEHAAVGVGG